MFYTISRRKKRSEITTLHPVDSIIFLCCLNKTQTGWSFNGNVWQAACESEAIRAVRAGDFPFCTTTVTGPRLPGPGPSWPRNSLWAKAHHGAPSDSTKTEIWQGDLPQGPTGFAFERKRWSRSIESLNLALVSSAAACQHNVGPVKHEKPHTHTHSCTHTGANLPSRHWKHIYVTNHHISFSPVYVYWSHLQG